MPANGLHLNAATKYIISLDESQKPRHQSGYVELFQLFQTLRKVWFNSLQPFLSLDRRQTFGHVQSWLF